MKTALFVITSACAAFGQMQDNRNPQMTCDNRSYGRQGRHCDIREQTIAAAGRLDIDANRNGGATVKGWLRNDVLVRAKIEAWADTDSDASLMTGQVHVDIAAGRVSASGPSAPDKSGWSVSYEIFVPQNTDLNVTAFNGGITLSDVRGRIQFETRNGGVHLQRVSGDVTGMTTNGGVNIELAGNSWDGRQLEVSTRNGGVNLAMPERYSAHIQTETVNGGIRSDFPVTVSGQLRPKNLDFNLGSGGPLIHVSTTNGGVNLRRM